MMRRHKNDCFGCCLNGCAQAKEIEIGGLKRMICGLPQLHSVTFPQSRGGRGSK